MMNRIIKKWLAVGLALMLAFSSMGARLASTSLRGTIFEDLNRNGRYDKGEPGLVGVYIRVSTPDGTFVHDFYSGKDGTFGPTLGQGTFTIRLLTPTGWNVTTKSEYKDVFVIKGTAQLGLDFGLVAGAGAVTLQRGTEASTGQGSGGQQTSGAPTTLPVTGYGDPYADRDLLQMLAMWCAIFGLAFIALTAIVQRKRSTR
jgi:hypothetical protein